MQAKLHHQFIIASEKSVSPISYRPRNPSRGAPSKYGNSSLCTVYLRCCCKYARMFDVTRFVTLVKEKKGITLVIATSSLHLLLTIYINRSIARLQVLESKNILKLITNLFSIVFKILLKTCIYVSDTNGYQLNQIRTNT